VIYQDDDLGSDALLGLHEAAEYYGMNIVAEEPHERGAVEFGSQVLNLRRAGATHVILWTVLRESAAILQEAHTLEWDPHFIGWFGFADDRIVELAGEAAANLEVLSLFDPEREDPAMTEYLDALARDQPDHRIGFYHAGGFGLGQMFVEALRRAGPDLTREKLIEALETFDHWDQNVWGHPYTYGPGLRGGSVARTFFARPDVEKGRLVRETEDILFEMPDDALDAVEQGAHGPS
jgi:branched-chain amino acid transport system substrate-binding protein